MYEVRNDVPGRTLYVTLRGAMRTEEMRRFTGELEAACDAHGGRPHLCLADMKGLTVMDPEAAQLLRESIAYTRRRGVVLCAHVVDSTLARLQTLRIGLEASGPDATIDCTSVEEAERVLAHKRRQLEKEG